jgi:hypothetical protein
VTLSVLIDEFSRRDDMKNSIWFVLLLPVFLVLGGCFQVDTVVRLNPDGSGTVEETVMMSKAFSAQMNSMMQGFGGEEKGKEAKGIDLYDPAKLKAQAAAMGKGVTFVTGKRVTDDKFDGYKAIYAFTDINSLVLNQKRGDGMPGGTAPEGGEPLSLVFVKGPPASLKMKHEPLKKPEPAKAGGEAAAGTPQASEAEMAKAREMFAGMRFSMALDVNGRIVRTNATHREGSRITLFDLDFEKLLGKPECLAGMKALQTQSLEEAKELLKNMPGMKVDLNDSLEVVFN